MELMKQAGYDFKIVTSDTPEITTKTAPFDVALQIPFLYWKTTL